MFYIISRFLIMSSILSLAACGGGSGSSSETDSTPTAAVGNFSVQGGASKNLLSWDNPTDVDFARVEIRMRSDGTSPVDSTDGTLIHTALSGELSEYTHTGLINHTNYLYKAFAIDEAGNIATGTSAESTPHGPWSIEGYPKLPTARRWLESQVVNGIIYTMGGGDAGTALSTVEAFDKSRNTWSTLAPMTVVRKYFASAVVNGHIYVFGGRNDSNALISAVHEFDTGTASWSNCGGACPVIGSTRDQPTASAVGDTIYIFGGNSEVEAFNTTTNNWTNCGGTCEAASTVVGGRDSAVVNGKVYVFGGNGAMTLVEEFDPASGTWTNCGGTCTDMPTGRETTASVVFEQKIYVFGGYDGSSAPQAPAAVVEVFDPTTNSWSTCVGACAPMLHPRNVLSAALVDNEAFLIGGTEDFSSGSNLVETYQLLTDTWKSNMPTSRSLLATAVVGDTLYVAGGTTSTSSTATDVVEAYNFLTESWSTKANMPAALVGIAGVAVGSEMFVMGGSSAFYSYDTTGDTWSTLTAMSVARSRPAAAVSGGKIYVFGGGSTIVEEYTPGSGWTNCGGICEALAVNRTSMAAVEHNGKIYIIGGSNGGVLSAEVLEFDPTSGTWTDCGGTCAPLPTPRNVVTGQSLGDHIYIIGGTPDFSNSIDTVETFDPVLNQWTACGGSCTPLLAPNNQLGSVVYAGNIFTVGGTEFSQGIIFDRLERYDPAREW